MVGGLLARLRSLPPAVQLPLLAALAAAAVRALLAALRWRRAVLSLRQWRVVADPVAGPPAYWVEHVSGDPARRFRAPDASNRGVHGIPHPPFISQPNWDRLRSREGLLRATDIVVCTFPKTGTTLTEQIILLLLDRGDPARLLARREHGNAYDTDTGYGKVWVETVDAGDGVREPGAGAAAPTFAATDGEKRKAAQKRLTAAEFAAAPAPRVVKTHAPREIFLGTAAPGDAAALLPGLRVVYVTRNAKDACVSSYYHAANPHKLGWPFDAWCHAWTSGLFEHGTWFNHVRGWRAEAARSPEQVLWVRYEDILAEPRREVARIAAFIGVDAAPGVVDATARHSSFAAMSGAAKGTRRERFFRKGEVGDWRRHFTPALAREFDEVYAKEMAGVDVAYPDG